MEEIEKHFICPYCGEEISMLLDLTAKRQTYIEDCEVCCRPIQLQFVVVGKEIESFHAARTEG